MNSPRDYYEVLGIQRDASADEIRKAYRKLVKTKHPDVNKSPNAEEQFKEIKEAYEILNDTQKRGQYDQFGHAASNQAGGQGFAGGFSGGFGQQDFGFGDIFDIFFGGGGRVNPRAPRKGNDLEYKLSIDFREAAFGKTVDILLQRPDKCTTCDGTGAAPGSEVETCASCRGTGQAENIQNTPFGRIVNRRICNVCSGTGKKISKPCTDCRGEGRVNRKKKIQVKIPAGIHESAQLRINGEGEPGTNGGLPGDLYISINVKPDPYFSRSGNDIICELPISFAQATLGDEITVPTLDGKAKLRVPSATQPGTELRLAGKGIPFLQGSGCGDMLITVRVVVPLKLTDEQKQSLRHFNQLCGEQVQEQHANFFDRVKRAFKGE